MDKLSQQEGETALDWAFRLSGLYVEQQQLLNQRESEIAELRIRVAERAPTVEERMTCERLFAELTAEKSAHADCKQERDQLQEELTRLKLQIQRVQSETDQHQLVVRSLSGEVVLSMSPVPGTLVDVKTAIRASKGVPVSLQRLMLKDGADILSNDFEFGSDSSELLFIVDETPLYSWNIHGNPSSAFLSGGGSTVAYSEEEEDYINVLTQEPVQGGFHYFEFVMHKVQDEQWCGVTPFAERAGSDSERYGGWFYYCGRREVRRGEPFGELHLGSERNAKGGKIAHVQSGDIIGMLMDADEGILVFFHNGLMQQACAVEKRTPLYLSTSLDEEQDKVELRKPPVNEAPLDLAAVRALPRQSLIKAKAGYYDSESSHSS